jgi:hypothetical protein
MGKRKAIKKLLKPSSPLPVYQYEEGVALEDMIDLSDDAAAPAAANAPSPSASPASASTGSGLAPPPRSELATPSASESDADGFRDSIREKLGGKKKSSKQRFAERQVGFFAFFHPPVLPSARALTPGPQAAGDSRYCPAPGPGVERAAGEGAPGGDHGDQ